MNVHVDIIFVLVCVLSTFFKYCSAFGWQNGGYRLFTKLPSISKENEMRKEYRQLASLLLKYEFWHRKRELEKEHTPFLPSVSQSVPVKRFFHFSPHYVYQKSKSENTNTGPTQRNDKKLRLNPYNSIAELWSIFRTDEPSNGVDSTGSEDDESISPDSMNFPNLSEQEAFRPQQDSRYKHMKSTFDYEPSKTDRSKSYFGHIPRGEGTKSDISHETSNQDKTQSSIKHQRPVSSPIVDDQDDFGKGTYDPVILSTPEKHSSDAVSDWSDGVADYDYYGGGGYTDDYGFGEGSFVDDKSDCDGIDTRTCSADSECSCYGIYYCIQGRCTTQTSPQKESSDIGIFMDGPIEVK